MSGRYLRQILAKISDIFGKDSPFVNTRVAAIENPEAISYGRDFIIALRSSRQKVNGKNEDDKAEFGVPEIARLYSTKLHGLLIGVRPGAPIPVEAQRFSALIGQAGFADRIYGVGRDARKSIRAGSWA